MSESSCNCARCNCPLGEEHHPEDGKIHGCTACQAARYCSEKCGAEHMAIVHPVEVCNAIQVGDIDTAVDRWHADGLIDDEERVALLESWVPVEVAAQYVDEMTSAYPVDGLVDWVKGKASKYKDKRRGKKAARSAKEEEKDDAALDRIRSKQKKLREGKGPVNYIKKLMYRRKLKKVK